MKQKDIVPCTANVTTHSVQASFQVHFKISNCWFATQISHNSIFQFWTVNTKSDPIASKNFMQVSFIGKIDDKFSQMWRNMRIEDISGLREANCFN